MLPWASGLPRQVNEGSTTTSKYSEHQASGSSIIRLYSRLAHLISPCGKVGRAFRSVNSSLENFVERLTRGDGREGRQWSGSECTVDIHEGITKNNSGLGHQAIIAETFWANMLLMCEFAG